MKTDISYYPVDTCLHEKNISEIKKKAVFPG